MSFGIIAPLIGGFKVGLLAVALSLSAGGVILLVVLGVSASYIAVPTAMRVALPDVTHSLSITASLGITFPFNVMVAIPAYIAIIQWWMA